MFQKQRNKKFSQRGPRLVVLWQKQAQILPLRPLRTPTKFQRMLAHNQKSQNTWGYKIPWVRDTETMYKGKITPQGFKCRY